MTALWNGMSTGPAESVIFNRNAAWTRLARDTTLNGNGAQVGLAQEPESVTLNVGGSQTGPAQEPESTTLTANGAQVGPAQEPDFVTLNGDGAQTGPAREPESTTLNGTRAWTRSARERDRMIHNGMAHGIGTWSRTDRANGTRTLRLGTRKVIPVVECSIHPPTVGTQGAMIATMLTAHPLPPGAAEIVVTTRKCFSHQPALVRNSVVIK